jgi:cation diffusion facilitator CzcD-associated flavoprotein CzcO
MHDFPHYQVVILGAGLCGLSTAYHLEEKGNSDYLLLERNPKVGGLARTETVKGFFSIMPSTFGTLMILMPKIWSVANCWKGTYKSRHAGATVILQEFIPNIRTS